MSKRRGQELRHASSRADRTWTAAAIIALAVSVLAAQKDQLAILAQIDEINGMLVNLVS